MAAKEKQVVDSKKTATGFMDQHMTVFGVLAESAGQMAAVQQSLFGFAASCTTNLVESAIAVQTEIARMSMDAMVHGDPIALMSLGQRAARTGFRETMDCAARNLATAQSLGAQILDTVSTPPGSKPGTP